MGPGLGPQGKLEGLCVGTFNNCLRKFVQFFNGSGKKALFLYILVLQPALFINLSGNFLCGVPLDEVIWNFYC